MDDWPYWGNSVLRALRRNCGLAAVVRDEGQLAEMRHTGNDTHDLAVAAAHQAEAAKAQSEQAGAQTKKMAESLAKTDDLVRQATAQARATNDLASQVKRQADTAGSSLVLQERPWVKVKDRILAPLTFNVEAWKGPVVSAKAEDTLENVGQSVALDVLSWEDIIPIDADLSLRSARERQNQWCDANRHQSLGEITGHMIFPKDPMVQVSTVGPPMDTVLKAARLNPP